MRRKIHIDFMKERKLFLSISGAAILAGLISIFFVSGFNQGIDFTGGVTAQLTVNFEKSDIGMLRTMFADVELEKKLPGGKTSMIKMNLGGNIAGLESKETKPWPTASYLVRFKNEEGIDKDQYEAALNRILEKAFKQKTLATLTVKAVDAADNGAALEKLVAAFKFEIKKSSVTQTDAGKQVAKDNFFYLSREYKNVIVEKELRDKLDAALAGNPDFEVYRQAELNAGRSELAFVVRGRKAGAAAEAGAAALKKLLDKFAFDDVKTEKMDVPRGEGKTETLPLFTLVKRYQDVLVEKDLRNEINKLFAGNQAYRIATEIQFASTVDWGSFNAVSATMGEEMRNNSIWLSLLCVFLMMIYIAVRFDWKFGVAAALAIMHDVPFMLGYISIFGRELNIPVIAAVLTIFGYSINDTIVVFDRIRENLANSRKENLLGLINLSINQSLSRTINTSMTVMLACVALYLFAGEVLRDFSLLLMIGVVVGTYSSIYIASPLYYALDTWATKREEKKLGHGTAKPAKA